MKLSFNQRIAYLGLFLCFSLILSYIESLFPTLVPIPGIKLGLSNLGILMCLYILGPKDSILISILKAVISSLLFGNMTIMIYSLAGAIFSVIIMILLYKSNLFNTISISGAGGVFHNIAQLCVALVVMHTNALLFYIPILIISGLLTGVIIGFLVNLIMPIIKKLLQNSYFV